MSVRTAIARNATQAPASETGGTATVAQQPQVRSHRQPEAHGDFARVAVSPANPMRGLNSGLNSGLNTRASDERAADAIAEQATGIAVPKSRQERHAPLTALFAPRVAETAARSAGYALDSGIREEMEAGIGTDFDHVRVHTGPEASRAAAALSSRAFAFGQHIVFGAGQYNTSHSVGRHLLAHELAHTAQQRAGDGTMVQLDVVDDIEDKLSYGLFDWAIRDGEAIDSLALLAAMTDAKLSAALNQLGAKYIDRLLDNLPDSAKSGESYSRVLAAIGTARTMNYASEQLEYGLFDWAITDAESSRVFNLFTNLPATERTAFLVGLNKVDRLGRLLGNATVGHFSMHIDPWLKTLTQGALTPEQRGVVRAIVEEAPDSPIETLMLATKARYDVDIGSTHIAEPGMTAVDWKAGRLRETYLILDHLPDAHVSKNDMLRRFGQFSEPQTVTAGGGTQITGGVYSSGQKELAINAEELKRAVRQQDNTIQFESLSDAESSEFLSNSVLHETGHSVDAQMGWSKSAEPALPERGGWKDYKQDFMLCATDMVDDASGAIKNKLNAAQRADVIADIASAMISRNAASLENSIRARPWFAALPVTTQTEAIQDKALHAVGVGLSGAWNLPDGGDHLDTHVYQDPLYDIRWVRYEHQARSRMLRDYQFRDIGEWFAECYAWYYTPDKRGKGAKLYDKDRNTKLYFDTTVDKLAASR